MLPSMSWMEDRASEGANNGDLTSLSSFKSMLGGVEEEDDWFVTANNQIQTNFAPNLLDSSASSNSVFSHIDLFLHPKPPHHQMETAFDIPFENPFNQGFSGFNELVPNPQIGNHGLNPNLNPSLNPNHQLGNFQLTQMMNLTETPQLDFGPGQFANFGENLLFNRPKMLKPLDNFTSIGSPPTLFQKRAALRKNLANNSGENVGSSANSEGYNGKRKFNSGDEGEDMSMDGYDSEDFAERVEESGRNGGNCSNGNSTVTINGGDQKGKKKGLPAKNLMAERRRRKKLNDRLYMLRSVVPKISKMDRASILGDAIEYLKELLQKINDLHNELETNNTTPGSSSALTPNTASFYPVTPTTPGLSSRIKEELCPSSLPSPNGQPVRVEVRQRDGRAVNIHMFCGRRPGLLLSTMRALDNLGLDIQQAVISCFNGFALDIFRAEQCREGQEVHPDQIKAVLLDSAGLLA